MQVFVMFVLIMVALDRATCDRVNRKCDSSWDRFGRKCYKYIAESKTWAEAEQYCLSIGGNLASVHSNQTQNFLKGLVKSKAGSYLRTWIGGHDATQDFIWLWSDGSKFDYNAWHTGEPNNGGWAEKCIEINYGDEALWNDARCNIELYFVCQKAAGINFSSIKED